MTKKRITPRLNIASTSPAKPLSNAPEMAATWKVSTDRAAIARRPSNSGKRGLPGGGATAGEVLIGREASACGGRR